MTSESGTPVFSSSTAPKASAKGTSSASKSPARAATTPASPTRGATGDLWTGVGSGGSPSLASAASAGGQGGGLGSSVIAGLAILGLGLTGLAGGMLVARRRAGASSTR